MIGSGQDTPWFFNRIRNYAENSSSGALSSWVMDYGNTGSTKDTLPYAMPTKKLIGGSRSKVECDIRNNNTFQSSAFSSNRLDPSNFEIGRNYGHDRINSSQLYDRGPEMILRSRNTGIQPLGQHSMRNMLKTNPILYGNTSDHVQNCYISPLPSPGLKEVVSTYASRRPEAFFSLPGTAGTFSPKKKSCGQRFLKSIAGKILIFVVLCAIMTTCFYLIIDAFRKGDPTQTPEEKDSSIKIIYSKNDDAETVLEAVTS